jgi:hypothetical protein
MSRFFIPFDENEFNIFLIEINPLIKTIILY